ncbi:nicalin-1-like [Anneissia japonica]|uniref:nicalin-1-like n=1 Tax=Anneissia japonica TaxID=1529436 RepID=UPI001425678C|nr:nicalin-1-like [Anneissia japonica]
MWIEEANEMLDMLRGSIPLTIILIVPVLIMISPCVPVDAAHEFSVYRMQQYDLQGTQYGCRNALVNMEARPINSNVMVRRCLVTRLAELTAERYQEIIEGAGALLVLLPKDINSLPQSAVQYWLELEPQILEQESKVPIYFAYEDDRLLEIYNDISTAVSSDQAASGAEALLGAVYANGFQMVVSGSQSKPMKDATITSLQGKLSGKGIEDQLPTIAIVAHYDSFGVAPYLARGGDSNGSGVAALLELARLFSKLYANSKTQAKYNLLFLLSGGGKFNYQGTKRWIEDSLESTETTILSEVSHVLCLDSIGAGNSLFMHVSKPPKEGTVPHSVLQELIAVSKDLYPELNASMIHKKINLADDLLAWEHERFSMRRLPAMTVSHFSSHLDTLRNSILDDGSTLDTAVLARNVKIIAEGLARHLYGLSSSSSNKSLEVFTDLLAVNEPFLKSWVTYLSSQSRAAQLMTKDCSVVTTLEESMKKIFNNEVSKITIKADKREPEFIYYDGMTMKMNAYNVKPAVFDLFLAAAIACYIGIVYFIIQNFPVLFSFMKEYSSVKAKGQ